MKMASSTDGNGKSIRGRIVLSDIICGGKRFFEGALATAPHHASDRIGEDAVRALQLYVIARREFAARLIDRGMTPPRCSALMLTMHLQVLGQREPTRG